MEVASPLPFSHNSAGNKRQFPCSPSFDTTNRSSFSAGMGATDEYGQQRSKRRRTTFDESMEGDSENNINQSSFQSFATPQKSVLASTYGEFLPWSLTTYFFDLVLSSLRSAMSEACRICVRLISPRILFSYVRTNVRMFTYERHVRTKQTFEKHNQTTGFDLCLQIQSHPVRSFLFSGHQFKRSRSEAFQSDLQRVVETQAVEIESLKSDKASAESSINFLKAEHEKVLNENKILKRAVAIQQERQNQTASEIEAARQYKIEAESAINKLNQIILSLRYHLQAQPSHPGNDFMGFPPRPPDVF